MAFELDLLDLPPLVDPATVPESPSSSLSSPTDDETLPALLDDYPSAICSFAELSQFVTEDQTTTTRSHARSRPADYIPRPPNAFILFRSAFVKANAPQAVFKPKKGSSLSKIIGTVWKQLDKVEHDQWEQEAVRALARHREKYPDWRFRLSNMGLTKESCGRKRKGDEGDPDGRSGGAKRRRASEKNYGEQVIGFTNDAPITLAPVAQLKTSLSHARDPKAVDQPRKHASAAKPKLDVPTRIAAKLPSRHPHSLPFAATHRHPEPFPSPQAPLPVSSPVELVLDPNAIPYVPTPEAFDSLFDGIDTFSFPYSAASPVDPASPVSFGSPATPPFIPSSSPAPLTPTTEWFSRRGSMDSTASESQGGPYTPPAFDAPCFDLDVAVYNPTSLPAPIDPFIEGTPTYFNFDYDSSFVCESPVYGLTGDAPALAQSKYSSLTGWDMLSADSAV